MARRLADLVRLPIAFVATGPCLPQPKSKAGRLTLRSGRVTTIARRDPPTPPDMRFSASGG